MAELQARLAQLAELHATGRLMHGDYAAAAQEEIARALGGPMTGTEVAAAARALRALVAEGLMTQAAARIMAEKLLAKSRIDGLEGAGQAAGAGGEAGGAAAASDAAPSIDISGALRAGWRAVWARFWKFLAVFAVYIAVIVVFDLADQQVTRRGFAVVGFGLWVGGFMLNLLMQVGIRRISLALADDPAAPFGPANLFLEGPLLPRYLLLVVLVSLAVLGGFLLLVIPGIVFFLRYSQAFFAVLEGHSAGRAMRASRELTYGHKGRLLIFFLLLACLNLVGLAALGLGLLVTWPMSLVATGVVYRQLQGRA